MNTVTIKINGIEYNLKGKENQDYLLEIARYVDGKVRDIMSNNRKLSTTDGATLTALNIADKLFKSEEEAGDLIKKRDLLEARNTKLEEQLKAFKSEVELVFDEKNNEIEKLNSIIKSMEEKNKEVEELNVKAMEEKLKEIEDLISEVNRLSNDLGQVEEMTKEIEILNNKITSQEKIIDVKDSQCEEAKEIAVGLECKLQEIKEKTEEKYNEIEREKSLLKSGNDDLRKAMDDVYNKLFNLEEENKQLKKQDEENRSNIEKYKMKLEEQMNNHEVNQYKEEIEKLGKEINIINEVVEKSGKEKEFLKARNKEMKFQVQNYKYKTLDLEKKLIDLQVNLAKEKKNNNILLR